MSPKLLIGVVAAALLGVLGGYRFGTGSWPWTQRAEPVPVASVQDNTASHKVLYWKDPDGKPDFAPAPKKTADGRDYLPVYDEAEPPLAGTPRGKARGKGKVLYYRNPMGLADTSPVP
jgi:Cu(I)/Ag(I) efflux system membrane fusion protein